MISRLCISTVLSSTLLLGALMDVSAQTQPPRDVQNVANLSTSATVEVPQDTLNMVMNTTKDGPSASAVQATLKQALDAALVEAKKSASPGQMDVRTGNFSLFPRYSRDGKITGWAGTAEMVLSGKDFARISQTAGKITTLTVGNVSFSLSRDEQRRVEGEAQVQAIERFKVKATEISKAFGFANYTFREVSVQAGELGYIPPPRPMMQAKIAMAEASEPIPVEAGKSNVTVTVSGSIQMR